MKYKIDAAAHSALTPELQALYAATGEDYTLTVDGLPDNQAEIERINAHNQKLISEKRERDEVARQAQAERERIEQESLKQSGNFEALEKSYQEKLKAADERANELVRQRDNSSVEQESQRLASQLADTPTNQRLLQRFIKDRLSVVDGQVKVVDDKGQLSASTIDDLANEFKTSGDYDSLLVGTRGSGSGGNGTSGSIVKSANEYSEAERIDLANKNPELFKQTFK